LKDGSHEGIVEPENMGDGWVGQLEEGNGDFWDIIGNINEENT